MLTTVAAGRTFSHSHCIGMYGISGPGFYSPVDFALVSNKILYVINRGSEEVALRIGKHTVDHQFLLEFGNYGGGDGQFFFPASIDVDSDENVYISDDHLQRISIFDKEGKFLDKWGKQGSGDGELNGASGIAFDHENKLYVVDSPNHRVQVFTKEGKFLAKWGRQGGGDGEFNLPWGICLDTRGDVYVADWKNSRVQKFSPQGEFLAKFGQTDSGAGEIHRPSAVAVDSEGDVYVTDWARDRLQVFGLDGTFITSLVGDAQQPSPWAQTYIDANPPIIRARKRVDLEPEWRFRRPVAVNVDADDRILVLEIARHRIQVYNKEKDYDEPALNA